MKTTLGIDLGSQSIKIIFYNYQKKEVVAEASSPLEVITDSNGRAEQISDWWLDALKISLKKIPSVIRNSVKAIGISGQQHGFVATNRNGKVLTPVKMWCDTSTQSEAEEITAACGGEKSLISSSGNRMLASYTATKIAWFKKNKPDCYKKLAHILLPHDYLNYVLTGKYVMEYGDASGTGFLNIETRKWCNKILNAIDPDRDLSKCLPRLSQPNQFIGKTTIEFAKKYGLPDGVAVSTGGGDNMMGAIGTNNVTTGKLTMSLGSSGTIYAYSDKPIIDPSGNIAAFCSSTGGWLPLLCTMNCTLSTEIIRNLLKVKINQFDNLIANVNAGSDGLIMLPFFNGERTPYIPQGNGCFFGLTFDNCSKGHFLRATVEGATFALKFGLDQLTKLNVKQDEIILTGGGSNSAIWCQIVADICQLPVIKLKHTEAAAFGAALQALWALKCQNDPTIKIKDITSDHINFGGSSQFIPDPKNMHIYDQNFSEYKYAVEKIINTK